MSTDAKPPEAKANKVEQYRKYLSDEVKANNSDLQKNLIYIIAGALGLFLTLNEKLIDIKSAVKAYFLIMSVIFLLLALMIIVYLSYHSANSCMKMILLIDKNKNSESFKDSIEAAWEKRNNHIDILKNAMLLCFFAGIISEILFIYFNIFFK